MYQRTPFSTKDEAVVEFGKVSPAFITYVLPRHYGAVIVVAYCCCQLSVVVVVATTVVVVVAVVPERSLFSLCPLMCVA